MHMPVLFGSAVSRMGGCYGRSGGTGGAAQGFTQILLAASSSQRTLCLVFVAHHQDSVPWRDVIMNQPGAAQKMAAPLLAALLALAGAANAAQHAFVWTRLPVAPESPVPSARSNAAIGYLAPSSIVVFGGTTEDGAASGETWVYNFSIEMWALVRTSTEPSPRTQMSYASYCDKKLGHSWLIMAHGKG
jgi:hypothetical protein